MFEWDLSPSNICTLPFLTCFSASLQSTQDSGIVWTQTSFLSYLLHHALIMSLCSLMLSIFSFSFSFSQISYSFLFFNVHDFFLFSPKLFIFSCFGPLSVYFFLYTPGVYHAELFLYLSISHNSPENTAYRAWQYLVLKSWNWTQPHHPQWLNLPLVVFFLSFSFLFYFFFFSPYFTLFLFTFGFSASLLVASFSWGKCITGGDGNRLTQADRSTGFVRRLGLMASWVHGTDRAKWNITKLQQKEKKNPPETGNYQEGTMRAQAHGNYLSEHFSVNDLDDIFFFSARLGYLHLFIST